MEKTTQRITVDIEDLKNALLSQTEAILALIEKIVEEKNHVSQDIRILAATIGTNLGLHMITDEMIAEMIAYCSPHNEPVPKSVTVWVESEESNYEIVDKIVKAEEPSKTDFSDVVGKAGSDSA